ncbi:unnamed protein product [Cercospora beticola]|nr:unnamed protein product [Cercospora beticola]
MLQLQLSDESLSADVLFKRVPSGYASSASILPPTPLLSSSSSRTKSAAPKPRWDLLYPDEPISIKIVPQRYLAPTETSWNHRIGWISVINTAGQIIYDPFVTYPKEDGLKKYFYNKRYDVVKEDLLFSNGARDGKEVERNLMKLLDGRTVVVHGGQSYSDSFYFYDEALGDSLVWDTQKLYSDMQNDGQPTLSTVSRLVLGRSIRGECDDTRRPDQDATTAMELYLLRFPYDREAKRKEFEESGMNALISKIASTKKHKLKKAKSSAHLPLIRPDSVPAVPKRPETSHGSCRPSSDPPEKGMNAAAQFALRLQRRHFADLGAHGQGRRGSQQDSSIHGTGRLSIMT